MGLNWCLTRNDSAAVDPRPGLAKIWAGLGLIGMGQREEDRMGWDGMMGWDWGRRGGRGRRDSYHPAII